jgi:anti-sigma factor RsiW
MNSGQRNLSDYDLISFVDDELDPERREEVEAMIARDPAAAARVELLRRNDELVRAALGRIAAEPLPASLILNQRGGVRPEADADDAPIRAPIRQVRRIERIRREQRERLVALTVAAFAAGAIATLAAAGFTELAPRVLAFPVAYMFPSIAAEEAGDRMARRAREAFWTFAYDDTHPVDSSDPSEIASWLSRRVGVPVQAPDLSALRLRLLGAQLIPGELGPAALILYRAPAGNRIGLYVGRSSAEDSAFHYVAARVTATVWWMERGAGYAVVGRADRIGLFKVARLAQSREPMHAHERVSAAAPN